ncbi:DUF4838 domain-containing protein [Candidatus Poribacteria bacterium]|nr:DUF4838 domain-containing protein [Candidatus Poribacteria bacterium]
MVWMTGVNKMKIVLNRDADQVESFAADELVKYVKKMTGKDISIHDKVNGESINLGTLPVSLKPEIEKLHKDGFIIKSIKDSVYIKGKTSRGTLYGVYEYLQLLGVRWYFPGEEHEYIPEVDDVILKDLDIAKNPDMNHRGVSIHSGNTALKEWIDFAAKTKLNSIDLHSEQRLGEMRKMLSSRGLDYGIRRHFFGEVYPPDEDEMKKSKVNLLEFAKNLPSEIKELFLWPADKPLTLEKGKSLSDVILEFMNEMVRKLRTIRPDNRMSFIAYWSTWHAPKYVKPDEGIFLEIAPMFRCFSHGITDPSCPINSKDIKPVIEDLVGIFNTDEAHVLGYWLDASLFGRSRYKDMTGRIPQIGNICKDDLQYYKSKGVKNISTFAVGVDEDYLSRFASPMLFHYPALLWDTDTDIKTQIVDFCENYYGSRDLADVFQLNEHTDTNDSSPEKWDESSKIYSQDKITSEEILKNSTDDLHIDRLKRLLRELDHMLEWIKGLNIQEEKNEH